MDYGQGAIDLLEILGVDAEAVVGDLMNKMREDALLNDRNILTMSELLKNKNDQIEKLKVEHQAHLEEINEIASDSNIEVKCRSCDEYYVLDYPLSEFKADMSYCGSNESCCP